MTSETVERYTDAPTDYDGFGTLTTGATLECTRRGAVRKVAIQEQHLNWQEARYCSGLHICLNEESFLVWQVNKFFETKNTEERFLYADRLETIVATIPPMFDPSNNIAHAMLVVESVAQRIDEDEHLAHVAKLTYLELQQVSTKEWAATFSQATWNDSEWYEKSNVGNYPHTARASSAALAIASAALSLPYIFKLDK